MTIEHHCRFEIRQEPKVKKLQLKNELKESKPKVLKSEKYYYNSLKASSNIDPFSIRQIEDISYVKGVKKRGRSANATGGRVKKIKKKNAKTAEEDVFIYNQMGAKGIEDVIR